MSELRRERRISDPVDRGTPPDRGTVERGPTERGTPLDRGTVERGPADAERGASPEPHVAAPSGISEVRLTILLKL